MHNSGKLLVVLFVVALAAASKPSLGIDWGSEWLRICLHDPTSSIPLELITNEQSNRKTPNTIGFRVPHDRLTGEEANSLYLRKPSTPTVFPDLKRLVGHSKNSPDYQKYSSLHPHQVKSISQESESTRLSISFPVSMGLDSYLPEELLAMTLEQTIKLSSLPYLNPLPQAVVTIPNFFTQNQEDLVAQIFNLSNIPVSRIISDLTAVAIDYYYMQLSTSTIKNEIVNVIFYDIGSFGTSASLIQFDLTTDIEITVLDISHNFEVDGRLIDEIIIEWIEQHYSAEIKQAGFSKDHLYNKIKKTTKEIKEECLVTGVDICDGTLSNTENGKEVSIQLSKEEFEKVFEEKFGSHLTQVLDSLLTQNGKVKIQSVELFGGSSRLPIIQKILNDFAEKREITVGKHVNPEESAAFGAGILSRELSNLKTQLKVNEKERRNDEDLTKLNQIELTNSKSKIEKLNLREIEKIQKVETRNNFESYIFESKNMLENWVSAENDEILEKVKQEELWLEDEADSNTELKEYEERFNNLKKEVDPVKKAWLKEEKKKEKAKEKEREKLQKMKDKLGKSKNSDKAKAYRKQQRDEWKKKLERDDVQL